MNWSSIAQAITDILAVVLIFRLLRSRLGGVYKVFCAFLFFDLLSSLTTYLTRFVHSTNFDYRIVWIGFNVVGWILYLWMVYALLQAILAELPGILRFSRKLLNITIVSVIVFSLITSRVDEALSTSSGYLATVVGGPIGNAVMIAFDLYRVISTVALLVLLVILLFVLWFPVQMPRNLAVLSIGFLIYLAANTGLMLTRGLWSEDVLLLASNVLLSINMACYAYWMIFLTPQGEAARVRIGHGWDPSQQNRLMGQLEAMNASLLRAARR